MSDFAEIFPPGEFLREELDARGWAQSDLARIMGKSDRLVNEVVNARRAVTPETAKALSAAFGTSPQYWLNLENMWQLFQLEQSDSSIERKSQLYSKFPVRELIKRGWIEDSENIETLESRFCDFYQLSNVRQEVGFAASFRGVADEASDLQVAWLYRCWQMAKNMVVEDFSQKKLDAAFTKLKLLLSHESEVRHVPRVLAEAGVRFVLVEGIKGSKADGVCFWLDKNKPVVALSMRYGRFDWFWFTLIHELRHVANGDGLDRPVVDADLMARNTQDEIEVTADNEASDFLIEEALVQNFIARVGPMYSMKRIAGFARLNNIHPALLVGRLQHLEEVPYTHFRQVLVDIRDLLLPGALADGWGY